MARIFKLDLGGRKVKNHLWRHILNNNHFRMQTAMQVYVKGKGKILPVLN
jgi:hypothetical protein